jgi:AcrR family transcriptional regulator
MPTARRTSVDPDLTSSARLNAERRDRRREFKRDLIVRAAAEVFAELGFERATLDAVGERVGLTKASLYYYFKSKEELLAYVVSHTVRAQEEAVAALAHEGMTPEERLRGFILGHLRSLYSDPVGKIAARLALSSDNDPLVKSAFREYVRGLDTILADGVAAGVFRPVHPGIARNTFTAVVNAVTLWYTPEGPLTLDEVGNEICDLLLGGLLMDKSAVKGKPALSAPREPKRNRRSRPS